VYGLYHARRYGDMLPADDLQSERRYLAEVVPFPPPHMRLRHPNGDRKSREELQEEALEENFLSWARRYTTRFYFSSQLMSIFQATLIIIKCLARLNEEIGVLHEAVPPHPLFWVALSVNGVACSITTISLESVGRLLWKHRQTPTKEDQTVSSRFPKSWSFLDLHRKSTGANDSDLRESLLSKTHSSLENGGHSLVVPLADGSATENKASSSHPDIPSLVQSSRVESDITPDAQYKADWNDLFFVCRPDLHLIVLAFVFLILAALCQILVPRYTGKILDSLANYSSSEHHEKNRDIWSIPGFMSDMKMLLLVSSLGGIFAGIRGAIFTVTGGRMNVRLRVLLMDSLLCQDIGFFDVTKTGEITSRLTSDTMLVGDQVTLNINIFLRSLVQTVGVLIFMTMLSWQLTLLAFISVPTITVLSKWYGHLIRDLTKLMQKKLADSNSISEAVLASMKTVRAFGAEISELKDFESSLQKYLDLNSRSAQYYIGYYTVSSALPQLVMVVVLFYGGLLVLSDGNNQITSGQLVSFLLYLSSLSDAFSSMGAIWTSLSRAVGGADKVFELMHRKPKRKERPTVAEDQIRLKGSMNGVWGRERYQTERFRSSGLHPMSCRGEISFRQVTLFYPARPQKQVLQDLSLTVYPGQVVALVGMSVST
jgi:ABC-type multidrug transport system fused ATPase/permease subunit